MLCNIYEMLSGICVLRFLQIAHENDIEIWCIIYCTTEVMSNDPHHAALPPTWLGSEYIKIILIYVNTSSHYFFVDL